MAFGKGSRQCVGMKLAKAGVLIALASIFRRFGRSMRLHNAERKEDFDIGYDIVHPMPSKRNNDVMVMFERS